MEIVIVNSHGSETRIQCYRPEDRVYSQFHHSRVGTSSDFEDYSPYFLVCTQGYHVEGNNHDERWDPNLDSVVMDYIGDLLVRDIQAQVSTFYYQYDSDRKELVEDTSRRNDYRTAWIPLRENPGILFASRVFRDKNDELVRVRYDHVSDIFKNYLDTSYTFALESFEVPYGSVHYYDLSKFFTDVLASTVNIVAKTSFSEQFWMNISEAFKGSHVKQVNLDKHSSLFVNPFNYAKIYLADEAFMNSDIESDSYLFPTSRTLQVNGTNPDGTSYTITRETSAVREFYGCKNLTRCSADYLFESQYENSGVTRINGEIKLREQDTRVFYGTPVSGTVRIVKEENPNYPIVSESCFENTLVSDIEIGTSVDTFNTVWCVFHNRCFANCASLSDIRDKLYLEHRPKMIAYLGHSSFENCTNLQSLGANRLFALNHDASSALFNCYNLSGTVNVKVSQGDNWERALSYTGYSNLILSADSTLNQMTTKLDYLALGSKIKLIVIYEINKFKPLLADLNGNWLDWQAVFSKLTGVSNVATLNEQFGAGYGLFHVSSSGRVYEWNPSDQYGGNNWAYDDSAVRTALGSEGYEVFKETIGR